MTFLKKHVLSTVFAGLLFTPAFATKESLELIPGGGKQEVTLPFAYHHLQEDEIENVKYLPQFFYTTLSDEQPEQKVISGPFSPCVLLGLRNHENGRTIIGHKFVSNSLDHFLHTAGNFLEVENSASLQGILFTAQVGEDYTKERDFRGEITSLKALHEGRSQREEVIHIRRQIINYFNIEDGRQIPAKIFNTYYTQSDLGQYIDAHKTVIIDSQLNINSISIIHEPYTSPKCFHYLLSNTPTFL